MQVVFVIMGVLGLFGNGLVIFIYARSKSVRTPANHYVSNTRLIGHKSIVNDRQFFLHLIQIANLAIADFIIMIEAPVFIRNCIHNGPVFGSLGCTIYGLLGAVGGSGAILTLMAVSIDRYNVICHPLNPSRSSTNRKSLIAIALVWTVSM